MSVTVNKTRLPGSVIKTASGAVASVSDARMRGAIGVEASFEPKQDLHGYANPWVGGAGVNKLNIDRTVVIDTNEKGGNGDATTPRQFSENQVWIGITQNNYFIPWRVTSYELTESSVTLNVSGDGYGIGFPVKTTPGTSYYVGKAGGSYWGVGYYDSTGTLLSHAGGYNGNRVITVPENAVWVVFVLRPSINTEYTYTDLRLNDPSSQTAWSPYENLCPISGITSASAWGSGMNLLDAHDWDVWGAAVNKIVVTGDNAMTVSTSAYQENDNKYVLPVPAVGQTCVLSFHTKTTASNSSVLAFSVKTYKSDDTLIAQRRINLGAVGTEADWSIAVSANCAYINIGNWAYSGTAEITNIQLEHGSAITSFVPHVGDSVTAQLGEERFGGSYDFVRGKLTLTMGMVDLGTLTWSSYSYSYGKCFYATPSGGKKYWLGVCSSYYQNNSTTLGKLLNGEFSSNAGAGYAMFVRDDRYSDSPTFKSAVSGVQLCYELATPIVIDLTPAEFELFHKNNFVWSDVGNTALTYAAIHEHGG